MNSSLPYFDSINTRLELLFSCMGLTHRNQPPHTIFLQTVCFCSGMQQKPIRSGADYEVVYASLTHGPVVLPTIESLYMVDEDCL